MCPEYFFNQNLFRFSSYHIINYIESNQELKNTYLKNSVLYSILG